MIRAGSGAGSSVSDESPTHPFEHVSANKKAPPPAQDFHRERATGQPGDAYGGKPDEDCSSTAAAAPADAPPGFTSAAEGTCWSEDEPPPVYTDYVWARCLPGLPLDGPGASPRVPPNRHLTDDEQGTSSKFPEVKGDGAMRPLLVVLTVPADAGTDPTATSPTLARVPTPSPDNPLPLPRSRRYPARHHRQANERVHQEDGNWSEIGSASSPTLTSGAPKSKQGSSFAKDDTVSDDEELHHLAIALDASTTDATAASSGPEARNDCNDPINETLTDHVRPLAPADGVQAIVHAKFWDDESDDSGSTEGIDCGNEHAGRDHRRPHQRIKVSAADRAPLPRSTGSRQHVKLPPPAQAAQRRQRLHGEALGARPTRFGLAGGLELNSASQGRTTSCRSARLGRARSTRTAPGSRFGTDTPPYFGT